GSKAKLQFLVALYRGLSSVIDSEKKKDFAVNVVFEGVTIPDGENPDLVYYDSRTDSLMRYQDDTGMGVKLEMTNKQDSGNLHSHSSRTANKDLGICNPPVSQQHCVQTSSATGRVLRPKDKPLLILYLKNINLPSPD
ncbi:hypothetical protein OSTOST_16729, partial [Ostertagia ostertagi]